MSGADRNTGLRALFAVIGWATIAAQFALMVRGQPAEAIAGLTVKFVSYFTIETNILIALAMTLPAVAGRSRLGQFAALNSTRAGVTFFAVIVGVVYHVLLAGTWQPTGLQWWVDQGLHTLMPLLMLFDWLVLTPRTGLSWTAPRRWLIFPAVFTVWTLVHGAMTQWYPYWFMDVDTLGWARTGLCLLGLFAFFLIAGWGVVGIERLLTRDRMSVSSGR